MISFFKAVRSTAIVRSALRVSAVVGTILNVINQWEQVLSGHEISWFHVMLNYLVPYCVASYSAAKNETTRRRDDR